MAIATAVKRGSSVYVYDGKGRLLTTIGVGNGPNDGLTGYTSTTVSVRRGTSIYTYDEKGRLLTTTSAR
jgi:YD repeat-containing protein